MLCHKVNHLALFVWGIKQACQFLMDEMMSWSMWCSDVLCHCAGSCIQWGGRLNQGRKQWSSSNPGDARGCLFFWKRPSLGKPRCGGSTCQRSPPHRWGFTSGFLRSLTEEWIYWQNTSLMDKNVFRSSSLAQLLYLWIAASILCLFPR